MGSSSLKPAFVLSIAAVATFLLTACGGNAPPTTTTSASASPSNPSSVTSASAVPAYMAPIAPPPAHFEPADPQAAKAAAAPADPIARRRTSAITITRYAQTFTATSDGWLTAFQFAAHYIAGSTPATAATSPAAADLILEISKANDNDAPEGEPTILGQLKIKKSELSNAGSTVQAPNFVGVDLAPLHIELKKNQVYVIILRASGPGTVSLDSVTNSHYEQGQLFQAQENTRIWTPIAGNVDLAFRVFQTAKEPPAAAQGPETQTAALLRNKPTGDMIVENQWDNLSNSATRATTILTPLPPLAVAAVAFESHNKYYVQVSAFNSYPNSRTISLTPGSITITPKAGGQGMVINPQAADPRAVANGGTLQVPSTLLASNEGLIRIFSLGDLDTLSPGDYRVTLVFLPSVYNKTVDADLTLKPAP